MSTKLPEWVELLDSDPSKAFKERERLIESQRLAENRKRHQGKLKKRIAELQSEGSKKFKEVVALQDIIDDLKEDNDALKEGIRDALRMVDEAYTATGFVKIAKTSEQRILLEQLAGIASPETREWFIEQLEKSFPPEVKENFREPDKICLRKAMEACGMSILPKVMGCASGELFGGMNCLCQKCGNPFGAHPMDWRFIGYGNVPFLNILCDGRRVKL